MKKEDIIDLTKSAQSYAVANTPLFLLRKLREDSGIYEYARKRSGQDILSDLRSAMAEPPKEIFDYVRPYAYLVALSLKHDADYLGRIADVTEAQRWAWDWFEYLHHVLLQTSIPTAVQQSRMPPSSEKPRSFDDVSDNHQLVKI